MSDGGNGGVVIIVVMCSNLVSPQRPWCWWDWSPTRPMRFEWQPSMGRARGSSVTRRPSRLYPYVRCLSLNVLTVNNVDTDIQQEGKLQNTSTKHLYEKTVGCEHKWEHPLKKYIKRLSTGTYLRLYESLFLKLGLIGTWNSFHQICLDLLFLNYKPQKKIFT